MRSECSSAADPQPTDEWSRDASSEEAPLVDLRVDFKLCIMMHSIHYGQCPTYTLPTWFMPFPSTRRGPACDPLVRPKSEATMSHRDWYAGVLVKCSHSGSLAWNALLPSFHNIKDSKWLKMRLKTYYLPCAVSNLLQCMRIPTWTTKAGNTTRRIIIIIIINNNNTAEFWWQCKLRLVHVIG